MQSQFRQWRQSFWGQVVELVFLLFIVFLIRTFVFGLYQVPSGSMETTMLVGERFLADKFSYWFRKPGAGEIIACNDPTYRYSTNGAQQLFEQYVWGPENWTKRIIAEPNSHVQGRIEDGKPVVYVDGVKKDEPYINRYPLIELWRPEQLKEIKWLLSQYSVQQLLDHGYAGPSKSYDPDKPFNNQPFYDINPDYVIRDEAGAIMMIKPGSLRRRTRKEPTRRGADYWDGSDLFDVHLGPNEYWLMGDNRLGSSDSREFGPFKAHTIHARIVFRISSVDSNESWWIVDLIKHPIAFWSKVRWNRFLQRI
jgi:signal peptidase I